MMPRRIDLRGSIWASAEISGMAFRAGIADLDCLILLPSGPDSLASNQLGCPTLTAPRDCPPVWVDRSWGFDRGEDRIEVTHLLLMLPDDWRQTRHLSRKVGFWLDGLMAWTNVMAGVVVATRDRPQQFGGEEDEWGRTEGMTVSLLRHPRRVASATTITAAIQRLAERTEIPLAWGFLCAAGDRIHSDPRRGVIDACTAVEIALDQRIHEVLEASNLQPGIVEQIERRLTGLRAKAEFVNKMSGLPVRLGVVDSKLGRPRNKAAHRGAPPTRQEAEDALEVAESVVTFLGPRGD